MSFSSCSNSSPLMARIANLSGVSKTLPSIPRLPNASNLPKRVGIQGQRENLAEDFDAYTVKTTRRLALGLVSTALVLHMDEVCSAKDNGFWIDGPLPGLPPVTNNIANEKTGTRSFLKKGIYMADIGDRGNIYRLRKSAFDLLAMEDLVTKNTLPYVKRYVRLKSTFMYYDFDKVISAASDNDKQTLMDMANKLFDNLEKLLEASKRDDFTQTQLIYQEAQPMLQEVVDKMAQSLDVSYP